MATAAVTEARTRAPTLLERVPLFGPWLRRRRRRRAERRALYEAWRNEMLRLWERVDQEQDPSARRLGQLEFFLRYHLGPPQLPH